MAQLQEQILGFMPAGLRAFIDGSSRRDLLRNVDTVLLVFDNLVAHVESGTTVEFQADAHAELDPERLAEASKSLLQSLGLALRDCSVLLLLPPDLFVATHQKLPGISSDSVVSALMLQSESLLPANDGALALAINPKATEMTDEPVALWIRNSTLADLFSAFASRGIFIAAVKPRVLALEQTGTDVLDADNKSLTLAATEHNVLKSWLQIVRTDLRQEEFQQQWQQTITNETGPAALELNSIEDYLDLAGDQSHQEYSFFPQGALTARRQVEKGRKLMIAAGVLAAALLIASVPFFFQSVQFRRLAATLESQRELSYDARQDQAVVVSFENDLGPINDFPDQRVREAMFNLQAALSPNRLSSLEITKGLINIQGTSAEPQSILQRLEQDPMFTEVAFARATNNDRYYIGLRLSTVNFEAYMVRYFPDE